MADCNEFYDLIYAESPELEQEIKKYITAQWPDAKYSDASDFIHRNRFDVRLNDTQENYFFHALDIGWYKMSLAWQMHSLQNRDDAAAMIRRVVDYQNTNAPAR